MSFIPTTHASDVSNVSHKRLRWDKRFGLRDTKNWSDDVAKLKCFAFCQISSLNFTKKMSTPGDTDRLLLWKKGFDFVNTRLELNWNQTNWILGCDFGNRFQPCFTHFGSVISDRSNFLISDQLEKKECVLQSRQEFQGVLHPCLLQFLLFTVPSFYHRYSK